MPTPAQIIKSVAALQNDAPQDVYTNLACLPYLNMAMRALQEEFELNNIPSTEHSSVSLEVAAGVHSIGFNTTPALPSDLIEIQQIWESASGTDTWTPMGRVDFLPHYLENGTTINQFLIWAWLDQHIELIAANADNDLKLDYIKSIFVEVTAGNLEVNLPIINCQTYLEFKTAAMCSMFIGENETRAIALENQAIQALERSLGISVKGKQAISFRRRPFRSAWKSRRVG